MRIKDFHIHIYIPTVFWIMMSALHFNQILENFPYEYRSPNLNELSNATKSQWRLKYTDFSNCDVLTRFSWVEYKTVAPRSSTLFIYKKGLLRIHRKYGIFSKRLKRMRINCSNSPFVMLPKQNFNVSIKYKTQLFF